MAHSRELVLREWSSQFLSLRSRPGRCGLRVRGCWRQIDPAVLDRASHATIRELIVATPHRCPLHPPPASRLTPPRSGLERSDFVLLAPSRRSANARSPPTAVVQNETRRPRHDAVDAEGQALRRQSTMTCRCSRSVPPTVLPAPSYGVTPILKPKSTAPHDAQELRLAADITAFRVQSRMSSMMD